jgi:hypothetical protein
MHGVVFENSGWNDIDDVGGGEVGQESSELAAKQAAGGVTVEESSPHISMKVTKKFTELSIWRNGADWLVSAPDAERIFRSRSQLFLLR